MLHLSEDDVYRYLGVSRDDGKGFTDMMIDPARALGLTEAQAWAIMRAALRSVVGEIRRGTSVSEAIAVIDPVGQLRRHARGSK